MSRSNLCPCAHTYVAACVYMPTDKDNNLQEACSFLKRQLLKTFFLGERFVADFFQREHLKLLILYEPSNNLNENKSQMKNAKQNKVSALKNNS